MHAAAAIQAALTEQRRRDLVRLGWSPFAADFVIAVQRIIRRAL